eukprot:TRINITY_DN8428_c0_g1_i1.p1 TRINITY_DN8428_c0_g1~~TRINITY_DN8428_c0_g1_i1.p1  ORF type:complete len:829 (-),score=193.86 TRINITY_DN8428_c0_g1_i1:229-2715(-)
MYLYIHLFFSIGNNPIDSNIQTYLNTLKGVTFGNLTMKNDISFNQKYSIHHGGEGLFLKNLIPRFLNLKVFPILDNYSIEKAYGTKASTYGKENEEYFPYATGSVCGLIDEEAVRPEGEESTENPVLGRSFQPLNESLYELKYDQENILTDMAPLYGKYLKRQIGEYKKEEDGSYVEQDQFDFQNLVSLIEPAIENASKSIATFLKDLEPKISNSQVIASKKESEYESSTYLKYYIIGILKDRIESYKEEPTTIDSSNLEVKRLYTKESSYTNLMHHVRDRNLDDEISALSDKIQKLEKDSGRLISFDMDEESIKKINSEKLAHEEAEKIYKEHLKEEQEFLFQKLSRELRTKFIKKKESRGFKSMKPLERYAILKTEYKSLLIKETIYKKYLEIEFKDDFDYYANSVDNIANELYAISINGIEQIKIDWEEEIQSGEIKNISGLTILTPEDINPIKKYIKENTEKTCTWLYDQTSPSLYKLKQNEVGIVESVSDTNQILLPDHIEDSSGKLYVSYEERSGRKMKFVQNIVFPDKYKHRTDDELGIKWSVFIARYSDLVQRALYQNLQKIDENIPKLDLLSKVGTKPLTHQEMKNMYDLFYNGKLYSLQDIPKEGKDTIMKFLNFYEQELSLELSKSSHCNSFLLYVNYLKNLIGEESNPRDLKSNFMNFISLLSRSKTEAKKNRNIDLKYGDAVQERLNIEKELNSKLVDPMRIEDIYANNKDVMETEDRLEQKSKEISDERNVGIFTYEKYVELITTTSRNIKKEYADSLAKDITPFQIPEWLMKKGKKLEAYSEDLKQRTKENKIEVLKKTLEANRGIKSEDEET